VMLASANLPASQRLSIEKLDGARAARALASGTVLSSYDIKEKQQVLITQSGIARGQAVARADVALQDYYGKLPKDSLRDYSSAAQMQAIRNLAAGVPLRLSDLAPVNVIRKGDNVQLSIRKGALEITVTMLSLGNARSGQRILLLNPESGEKIQALAEGPGRARGLTSSAKMPDRQGLLRSNK
jgi:flagella basal body P-ring formation protein FlgA